jgi:hypothetical protein
MKKLFQSSLAILVILTGIAIISTSSYSIDDAMAFPHATLIIEPEDEHANDFQVVLGHTNEPAYGKLPGIHDGKHNLEVDLSDAAITHFLQINTISKILKVFNVQKVLKMRMLLNEMFQSLQYLVNLVPFIIDRLLILASMDIQ